MPDVTVSPSTVSVTVATASSVPWDPSTSVDLYSDFVADASPFGISTGTQGNPGSSLYTFGGDNGAMFGKINLSLSGTPGARIGVYAAQADTSTVNRTRLITDGAYDFKCRCNVTIAAALQRTVVGLCNTHGPASPTLIIEDGAAFLASGDTGNWNAVIATGNVMDQVATGYSTAQMRTLRITTNAEGTEVKFYIDGNLVRTAAPTWTTTQVLGWGFEMRDKQSGGSGTNGLASIDFMRLQFTVAR